MPEREVWTIVDRRTGKEVTVAAFPSYEWCVEQITQWQNRHDRGGRPDVTLDKLLNMEPRRLDA